MHAVIRSGGKQYRVAPGEIVTVERLAEDSGATITFDQVLMVSDAGRSLIGTPLLENASVTGTVAEQLRAPRVIVLKKKRRKNHRKRRGHRQHLTVVRITDIHAPGHEAPTATETEAAAPAETAVDTAVPAAGSARGTIPDGAA